jgi:hypothetical protein
MNILNVDNLAITLMRDYHKETLSVRPNIYLNYQPVVQTDVPTYRTVSLTKKDPNCYIKLEKRDLWVYEEGDKLVFKPLHQDNWSLCTGSCSSSIKQPQVFFIEYVEEPMFVLYKNVAMGDPNVLYLEYVEVNNYIYMHWVSGFTYATKFTFTEYKLNYNSAQQI